MKEDKRPYQSTVQSPINLALRWEKPDSPAGDGGTSQERLISKLNDAQTGWNRKNSFPREVILRLIDFLEDD